MKCAQFTGGAHGSFIARGGHRTEATGPRSSPQRWLATEAPRRPTCRPTTVPAEVHAARYWTPIGAPSVPAHEGAAQAVVVPVGAEDLASRDAETPQLHIGRQVEEEGEFGASSRRVRSGAEIGEMRDRGGDHLEFEACRGGVAQVVRGPHDGAMRSRR